ncbi:uncharacterized protein BT62DRAFT_928727 [Guyanagaster necrorhizus]|uniref:Uncharacterized protein n=1 Tax=Guyanagaster necrorhizus TaxID=856835 RepID=A0A9P7W0I8_9AGAR|nr:uncharacterized protein BT62DRAFT_928727 [Guyanagaster necrorhizus MCA 3950]KAG7449952.1 hypothetical protein BT62DRAFT_928727 [Guyanagaster necrorhizus MCA 3950]
MAAICPTNIQEFLTFLPNPPRITQDPSTSTITYTAHNILTPSEGQPILSRLDPTLIPILTEFITSVVADLHIGQSMHQALQLMRISELQDENNVNLYGEFTITTIEPVVHAIVDAAHLEDLFTLFRLPGRKPQFSWKGDFTITPVRENEKEGTVERI